MSLAALTAGPVKGTPVLSALSEQRRQTGRGLSPSPMPRTVRFLGHPGSCPAGATMLRRRAPGQGRPGLRGLQPQGGPKPALPPVSAPSRLTTPKRSTLPSRRVSLPAGYSAASGSGSGCRQSHPLPYSLPPPPHPPRRSRNGRAKRGRSSASALPRPHARAARAEAEPRTPLPGSGGAGRGGATGGAGLRGSLATLRCGARTRQGLRHRFTFQARP